MSRSRRATIALLAVAALFVTAGPAPAGEDVRDQIERLMPGLQSEQDEVRTRAEEELFALGPKAHQELQRLAQSPDPTVSALALKLLANPEWHARDRKVRPDRDEIVDRVIRRFKIDEFRDDLKGEMEKWRREFRDRVQKHFHVNVRKLLEEGGGFRTSSSGRIDENGNVFAWRLESDGSVKVTVRGPGDTGDTVYESKSLEEFRKAAPENVVKRLDRVLTDSGTRIVIAPGARRWLEWRKLDEWPEPPEFESLDEVRKELRRWFENIRRPRTASDAPFLGVETSPPSPALRAHLDLESGGLVVHAVLPDTAAERLGMKKHDILVELAGRPVASGPQIRAALETVEAGDTLTAVVIRKGTRVELSARR